MPTWEVDSLIEFENEVAELFNNGLIKHPIHLSNGNESFLIDIFKNVSKNDWVFGSWRSHLHCLLKGVPRDKLISSITDGKSIALCFPEQNIFSSAIVGGQLPIATGMAFALKSSGNSGKVWCFLGDMTSETGIAQTCIRYAHNNNLPITFVVEDNDLSVLSKTRDVWGSQKLMYEIIKFPNVISYKYSNKFPHAGAGVRVQF
jgi:TPP-dependent pyruvate/acetoin dehydrogenase alpha subunit